MSVTDPVIKGPANMTMTSSQPLIRMTPQALAAESQPVEFNSDQEVVDVLNLWLLKHPESSMPGATTRREDRILIQVMYQDTVMEIVKFTLVGRYIGWLLPCTSGKYLDVKPLCNRKKGLTA